MVHSARLTTLVDVLQRRGQIAPHDEAYSFLQDGLKDIRHLTYGELDRQARAIAGHLQSISSPGDRALLLYPPGLNYVAAFFGCLYAQVIAVPAYPPQNARSLPRIEAIVMDADPAVLLTDTTILTASPHDTFPLAPYLHTRRWMTTDTIPIDTRVEWRSELIDPHSIAFLQYTSGSTSNPKGVMVSHANLMDNLGHIQRCFGHHANSQGVIWLPPYHDMGLIGGILQPLFVGFPVALMAPTAFLQRPLRWLEAISTLRATTSGGPNFAYDLCARKLSVEQVAHLNLSSWDLAFCGAEPIRPDTLERFAAAFSICGFRREAFYPCYGLAEATLIVSGNAKGTTPNVRSFQAEALKTNRAIAGGGADSTAERTYVSCGYPVAAGSVVIADPDTLEACADGCVGEVLVTGPSVALGYWQQPEETRQMFHARVAPSSQGPFLRTGDLAFMEDGRLFITGRRKDLIIIRGRNYYPQDIELTIGHTCQELQVERCAAFTVDVDGEERVAVACEVDRQHLRSLNADVVIRQIRIAVAEQHEIQLYGVVLLKPGHMPRTTSGKVQRYACRQAFLNGTFELVASDVIAPQVISPPQTIELSHDVIVLASPDQRLGLVEQYLVARLATILRHPVLGAERRESLQRLGLDSLGAMELVHRLDVDFGLIVPITQILESSSVSQLAQRIVERLVEEPLSIGLGIVQSDKLPMDNQLSYGQRALWFMHQVAPESSAYTIARAFRLPLACNLTALKAALQGLVDRHDALRTVFPLVDGQPVQHVHSHTKDVVTCLDALLWTTGEINARITEEAYRPFDISTGPLFRITLLQRVPGGNILLLSAHHIIVDLASFGTLLRQLDSLYQAYCTQAAPDVPVPTVQYRHFTAWQSEMLATSGAHLWAYWDQQLSAAVVPLTLPLDHPHHGVQTDRAGSVSFSLTQEVSRQIYDLAKKQEATVFMVLLAAFEVLLGRYSGQHEFLIGSPTLGRTRAMFDDVVGYFVNPVVIRADLGGDIDFWEVLMRVRRVVLDALDHQDFPFQLLIERLQPVRDRSQPPLFQVMFSYQQAQMDNDDTLAALALDQPGATIHGKALTLESISLDLKETPFHLTLVMADIDGTICGTLQYNSDLFDETTVQRLTRHFTQLLTGAVTNPQTLIACLPLLLPAEQALMVDTWNATTEPYRSSTCIHRLFEERAAHSPEATALVFNRTELSFGELNARANVLANYLRRCGAGPESLIGIYLDRSIDMVVALLSVLKAGATYVPLDPSYPKDHISYIVDDARIRLIVTETSLTGRLPAIETPIVVLDTLQTWTCQPDDRHNPVVNVSGFNLAYVIYTSGSTGCPKGVMVPHQSVINFFEGMDQRVACGPGDRLIAVTSISFDISVLELFWTLTRGASVIILPEQAIRSHGNQTGAVTTPVRDIEFSLFYFAADESGTGDNKYRLLLDGARFADAHDFSAIWTPERHFHAFGGLYPNPSVIGAAIAVATKSIRIRGGSVVLPLHHPIRVAEEWSVVDNLSGGRVDLAFASGWHADDFAFYPDNYVTRKETMLAGIETVQRLWRGESVAVRGGGGSLVDVRIFPQPLQHELPIWITAAGNAETFVKAGEIGANVLTHLLGQSIDEVAEKIRLYQQARRTYGHNPATGHVTLMLHTYLGDTRDRVRETVRGPFTEYLRTSFGLVENLVKSLNLPVNLATLSDKDRDDLLAFAFERYFETSAMFGTVESCRSLVERIQAIGVNEIACLIDFGVDEDEVLNALPFLDEVRRTSSPAVPEEEMLTLAEQAGRYQATLLQCTPSLMQMLTLDHDVLPSLTTLRTLLLGGEALPASLVAQLRPDMVATLINMYGPTETTIWSATHTLRDENGSPPIGRPIMNTSIYILDRYLQPVPIGVVGELYIGGEGVARGYARRPAPTADLFIPDPFTQQSGARMYRSGDLARFRADGIIEHLGRADSQVKLHGYRIELSGVENVLAQQDSVREAVAVIREDVPGDQRLIAYVTLVGDDAVEEEDLKTYLRDRLPGYMVPSHIVPMMSLPLTPNGKIDRKALPAPNAIREAGKETYVAPQGFIEQTIAEIWQRTLNVEKVGINDSFFDLGGHSLLLAHVHGQLRETFGRDIPLIALLEHPTIRSFAEYLAHDHEITTVQAAQSRERALKQRQSAHLMRERSRPRG